MSMTMTYIHITDDNFDNGQATIQKPDTSLPNSGSRENINQQNIENTSSQNQTNGQDNDAAKPNPQK